MSDREKELGLVVQHMRDRVERLRKDSAKQPELGPIALAIDTLITELGKDEHRRARITLRAVSPRAGTVRTFSFAFDRQAMTATFGPDDDPTMAFATSNRAALAAAVAPILEQSITERPEERDMMKLCAVAQRVLVTAFPSERISVVWFAVATP